jgi:PhoPQ-activated pathogenicity-related protein
MKNKLRGSRGPKWHLFCFLLLQLGISKSIFSDIEAYLKNSAGQASWELLEKRELQGGDLNSYVIELQSQIWQEIPWKHRLRLLVPKGTKASSAILIIGGSRPKPNHQSSHEDVDKLEKRGREVAAGVASPVALLYDVPNQPLFGDLTEDRLIAETFRRYRDTKDENWPMLLPMVRSAVAAMDALQSILKKEESLSIENFMLTGASKRGWTTWLTATVDPRVFGIAPMVYDNLNLRAQMQHQLDSWGKYSPSISAYTKLNLPQLLVSEEGGVTALADLVDPWTRVKALTMPKLLINGTNDPFWVLDAYEHYKDDLPGEVYLHYAPNAGHGLRAGREGVISTTVTFFKYLQKRVKWPLQEATWGKSGATPHIHFKTDTEPFDVSLFTARNKIRDFRKVDWESESLELEGFEALSKLEKLKGHWQAAFLQAVYLVDGEELILSSEVRVIPPR